VISKEKRQHTVYMPVQMHKRLKKEVYEGQRNMSAIIRRAIQLYFDTPPALRWKRNRPS